MYIDYVHAIGLLSSLPLSSATTPAHPGLALVRCWCVFWVWGTETKSDVS